MNDLLEAFRRTDLEPFSPGAFAIHSKSEPLRGGGDHPESTPPERLGVGGYGQVRLLVASCFCWLACLAGMPSVVGEIVSAAKAQDHPRQLSLRTIFHPKLAIDFDGTIPTTRWIGGSPSTLVIKDKASWKRVDLGDSPSSSGRKLPWSWFERAVKAVDSLPDVDEKAARRAVSRLVFKLKNESSVVLGRIGKRLLAVSQDAAKIVTEDGSSWSHATLDPTGRWVGYCQEHDFFVHDFQTGRTKRLTDDRSDTLLDGEFDWMYQEEIFGRGNYQAFWFAPDGQSVAMLRIDISKIEPFILSSSADPRGRGIERRYSKPGDAIPEASLVVWDLSAPDGAVTRSTVVHHFDESDQTIITGVWWNPLDQSLWFCISDRRQTYREWKVFRRGQSDCQTLIREVSPAWVEPPSPPRFSQRYGMIYRSEVPNGVHQLYRLEPKAGGGWSSLPLTPETINIREFGLSDNEDRLWFTADFDSQLGNHVYQIDLKDRLPSDMHDLSIERVTTSSGWHAASISDDGKWMTDRYSTRSTPPLLSVRPMGTGTEAIPLASSKLLAGLPLITPRIETIAMPDGGSVPAMIVQPNLGGEAEQYPVVVEIYGGPSAAIVRDRWSGQRTLYRQLLALQGIGTMVVDNRSSAATAMKDTWPIRGNLGQREFADFKAATDWLAQQPWVDAERIAIRGWSYGGYMTLYAMTHSEAFAAGIAGGSVTDWRDYDAFYTERYMSLPGQNKAGYDQSSLLGRAGKLSGKLLMIHGEIDDNVHPANTLKMAKAFQKANIPFRLMIYPGAKHGVTDPLQSWHLRQMTHDFLIENLTVPNRK